MSCILNPVSCISDVSKLQLLLRDISGEDQEIVDKGFDNSFVYGDTEAWDDDWESSDWQDNNKSLRPEEPKKPWLQECCVSLSPSEEILVLAKENKAIFLSQKWKSSRGEQSNYEISWSGNLVSDSDSITSILCIPLASQQRSSEGNPDWTSIISGFQTGYIRIYMTDGTLLLSQFLHDAPVLTIKLKTRQVYQNSETADQVDELVILYPGAIVTIDGFSLYQSLRACRSQLAKAQASQSYETIEPPPLAYRKWRITDHEKMSDVASCGLVTPCLFDRLQTASFVGGFRASVKGSSPAFNHFITTGKTPFLGVYQALEGSSPPIISEVAMAVANKLTSAVMSRLTAASGWWSGGQKPKTPTKPEKPKVELGTSLSHRYCLQDKHRLTEKIVAAPVGKLAVVTDHFNRVVLFDTHKGVVIRMWKGYRDADCGWIVVEEEEEGEDPKVSNTGQDPPKRCALFLVIYAPKRGILEIWLTEHGSRVGAFNVGKDCRLLYQGYEPLGRTGHSMQAIRDVNGKNQCYLLQADGSIRSIHVPFHCSLSSIHSVRVKDQHLLKKLTSVMEKGKDKTSPQDTCKALTNIIFEIQVPSSQLKAVQCILESDNFSAEFYEMCLKRLCNKLQAEAAKHVDEDIEFESEREDLIAYCEVQCKLIETFLSICALNQSKGGSDTEIDFTNGEINVLSEVLHISFRESEELIASIQRYADVSLKSNLDSNQPKKSNVDMSIALFLSCFLVDRNQTEEESTSSRTKCGIGLHDSLSHDSTTRLGTFIFQGAVNGEISISKLMLVLESSNIPPKQTMMLLTAFTQSHHCHIIMKWSRVVYLHSLVSSICAMKGGPEQEATLQPVGEISPWWSVVRQVLCGSVLIGQSLLMAVVSRSVSIEISAAAQKVKQVDESDLAEGGWVSVTVDMEQWNLLVSQLEDLLALKHFVNMTRSNNVLEGIESPKRKRDRKDPKTEKTPLVPASKTSERLATVCVKGLLESGHGGLAQIVADCLVRQGVPGPCLGKPKPKRRKTRSSTVGSSGVEESSIEEEDLPNDEVEVESEIVPGLGELRERFPFSLGQDVLWAHCAWECIMVWNEDTENVAMLSSALVHLSCIHNAHLQHGLGVMMWKAVFKDIIKLLINLVEKVGKAPKDRLCKKTMSLGYKALQNFMATAKQLLEILSQVGIDEEEKPEFKAEDSWKQISYSQRSITDQAIEEPISNPHLIDHLWMITTSLYIVLLAGMKGVKPFSLLDTKGKHAFSSALHGTPMLSTQLDDKIHEARKSFCFNALTSLVKNYVESEEEAMKKNGSQLLEQTDMVLELSRKMMVNEDLVRRYLARELYASGLDLQAQETAMYIENKNDFSSEMLNIIGARLAVKLLDGEASLVTQAISKLPTNISSWMQSMDISNLRVSDIPLSSTFALLQFLRSNLDVESKDYRFITELLESVKLLL